MIDIWRRSPQFRLAAVLAAVGVAAVLLYTQVIRDDSTEVPADAEPVAVSEGDLAALAEEVGHPIYWLGEQAGTTLEATRLPEDQVYVRYIGDGQIGDPRPQFLTVGTYAVEDAYSVQQAIAEGDDVTSDERGDGGLVIQSEVAPSSVYVAFPGQNLQVEVYDPNPRRAFRVATSDALTAID